MVLFWTHVVIISWCVEVQTADDAGRMSKIRHHYGSLIKYGNAVPWNVHIEYFKVLEQIATDNADEILRRSSQLIRERGRLHRHISDFFWRTSKPHIRGGGSA